MALFDEDGNPIGEGEGFPTIPTQPPREVHLSIKDKDEENFTSVDADGNLQVKVTSMPPIEIDTTGLEINVSVANQVEVTNTEGDPIPVSGTVDVGNFPETQAVSIADVVEVSFAEVPTVTISNPVTEVSVSNFPEPITSIEVSNFPEQVTDVTVSSGVEVTNFPEPITSIEVSNFPSPQESIEVSNFPTSFDVTVSNPTTEVTVSNFPTEIEVNNHPTTIEVSNFPEPVTEVTVSNFPTTIEVSNQPTTIEVSNFPEAVTEVSVSNMLQANDIVNADKNYIDTQYTIFSDNTSFYADAMPPSVDPYGRDGFHYLNNYAVGATTAQKKINWYYYDPSRITARYNEYQNTWALVTMDKVKNPFFVMYTGASLTALPTSTYVWAVPSITTQVSTTYLFWTGTEAPPATLYPDVPRVQLTLTTSGGTRVATEYILAISLHTASDEASNTVEIQVYKLGYKVLNKNYDVKLEMKTATTGEVTITNTSPIPVSGTVDANVTFPESQTIDGTVLIDSTTAVNVTVSNPTTSVEVSVLPAIEITNTGFDVTNTPTVKIDATDNTVKIDDSAPVDVNITNTLTIEPPENQDVTITNASVNVTIDNPTTSVDVDNFPTSFEVSNFPTNQTVTVDNSVDVASLPAINITNTSFEVSNFPINQTVSIDQTNNNNVVIINDDNNVKVDVQNTVSNPIPVNFSNTTIDIGTVTTLPSITIENTGFDVTNQPTVTVDDTTAIKVDIQNADVPVTFSNTTIDVGIVTTLPDITILNTSFDIGTVTTLPDVTFTNTTIDVGTITTLPNIAITNTEFGITSTQNSVKLTDGTNTASVTATSALKTTISEGVGTLSTTPMFITIVGAIDGGNWNTP